jgi:hypothetical protein
MDSALNLKQKLRADICQRHIPDLVERDQFILLPACHHFSDLIILLGFYQFIDQCGRRDETNTPLLSASRQTKATGQVALARTARALTLDERESVRALLNSERFQDCSPAAINATRLGRRWRNARAP